MGPQNDPLLTPKQDLNTDIPKETEPVDSVPSETPQTVEPKPLYSMTDPDGEPPVVSDQQNIQKIEDVQDTMTASQSMDGVAPPPKSKKKLVLVVVAAIIMLLGVGGGGAFAFWYNTPDVAVADALRQTLLAKSASATGTYNYTNSSKEKSSLSLAYTFASNESKQVSSDFDVKYKVSDKNFDIKTRFVGDKDGTFYIKAENFRAFLNSFIQSTGFDFGSMTAFDGLINKIDGKWVMVSPSDIKALSSTTNSQSTCAENAIKTFQSDKKQQDEVVTVYKSNPFVGVSKSLGTEMIDGKLSNRYELKGDTAKAQSFAQAVTTTTVFKAVDSCYENELTKLFNESKNDTMSSKDANNGRVELWVDVLTHKPTKLKLVNDDKTSSVISETKINLGEKPQITIPKADTTINDLKTEATKIQESFTSSFSDQSYTSDQSFSSPVLGLSTFR